MNNTSTHTSWWSLGMIALLMLGAAEEGMATCASPNLVQFSQPSVSVGNRTIAALPHSSDIGGYRQFAPTISLLRVSCANDQTVARLQFNGVVGHTTPGLLQWNSADTSNPGALRMKLFGASAGGLPLNMRILGATTPAASTSVVIPGAGTVVELDLSGLPVGSRKNFSVQVETIGLVKEGFSPGRVTQFSAAPTVVVQ